MPKLEGYDVDLVPETEKTASFRAAKAKNRIRITLHGDYFVIGAMPLVVKIGDVYLNNFNISSDGRTISGFLDEIPEEGSVISVSYGDRRAELPEGFSLKKLSEEIQPDYADETNSNHDA